MLYNGLLTQSCWSYDGVHFLEEWVWFVCDVRMYDIGVSLRGSRFSGRVSVSSVAERASLGIVRPFVNLPNFVLNLWAAMLQQFIGSLEEVIFSTSL